MTDDLEEPFFLTEEIEAEMIAAGHADYVFEPPSHVSTMRLTDILAARHGVDLPTLLVMFPELNL